MSLKEVYLGETLLWKKPKLLKGKFTDDSTASDWWYMDKPRRGSKRDISVYVDPTTKAFAIDPITITPGFYYNEKLERIDNIGNYGNEMDLRTMFNSCSAVTSLDLSDFDTSLVTDVAMMFGGCQALKTLILSGWDLSKAPSNGSGAEFYDCTSLTAVIGPISGFCRNLDLSFSPLTTASAMVFIYGLATVSSTKTLTLKSSTYNSLTAEQIAVATSKGWTVASA